MSTDHTELSRTSVGDFLKLVGDEVERASAFLSKTATRPALGARPPRKAAAAAPANTVAAHQLQQKGAQARGVDNFGSKGITNNSRAHDGLPVAQAPVRVCASPAAFYQEAFPMAGDTEEPLPASAPLNGVMSSYSAESIGPAAAAVSSRSASFVRFSHQGPLLDTNLRHGAAAAAGGNLPAMPSLGALDLSHTTASSAPSSSATSSTNSPATAHAGRQQPDAAIMHLPMPPLDALDLSHTTASSAPSTQSVDPQLVGDTGDGMEGQPQEPAPQGDTYHVALPGPEPAPVPTAASLRDPDDTAEPRTDRQIGQVADAAATSRQRSSTGIQEFTRSQQQEQQQRQQQKQQQRRGGGGYEAPARASSVLKACQADLLQPLLPPANAAGTAIDSSVRPSPVDYVTEQTERLGELKKSHIKVLRWLSQEQAPNYSPLAPSLGVDCSPCGTALQQQPQQRGTTLGPPLASHRASNILRAAAGNAQLRSQPMAVGLAEARAASYAAAPQQLQPQRVWQPHQEQRYTQAQTPLCTARQWSPHYQQPLLDRGLHSEAVRDNPQQLHNSRFQQEQPALLRHSPHKVQRQRPRSALVRLPEAGPCGDDRRVVGHCKPQLRLLRPLQVQVAAFPQRRPHSAGCCPQLPVGSGNVHDSHMAGGAAGHSVQQPQLALPWHSGQQAVPAVQPQLPGVPGAISIGNIQTAYFGATTLPAAPHNTSCLQGGLAATDFLGQAVHAHSSSTHGTNQRPAASRPQPEIDLWSAYLATRAPGGNNITQDLQNVDPADAVGQLKAISSRIKHMQGEITTFLGSSHAPGWKQGLLGAPSSSKPALNTSEDSTAQAGQRAGERARHQPGAESSVACQQPGVFDDDFVMSIKLGADYRALQQQARAAALAVAAGDTKLYANQHQEPDGTAGTAGVSLGAAAGQAATGKSSEAIDRLKGLRSSRGAPRVQHDTSIPVMRMPGRR